MRLTLGINCGCPILLAKNIYIYGDIWGCDQWWSINNSEENCYEVTNCRYGDM